MPSLLYSPTQTGVSPGQTPADASGAQFTPAVGQSLEKLGDEGGKIASDVNRIQYAQKNAQGKVDLDNNIADGFQKFKGFMEQAKGEVPETGEGYTQKFLDAYGQWKSQLIDQQPTPQLKAMAALQAKTLGNRFYGDAVDWEASAASAYRVNGILRATQTNANTLDQNPELFDTLLKNQLDDLHGSMGQLHSPQQMTTLENHIRLTLGQAATDAWVRDHPQEAKMTLSGALHNAIPAGDTPQAMIYNEAKNRGDVPPEQALAVASIENAGFDPSVNNAQGSGAHGLFQMMPDTFAANGGTDPSDKTQQVQAGVANLATNRTAFKKAVGRDPSPGELMLSQFGQQLPIQMAKAPDDMLVRDAAAKYAPQSADAIINANLMKGKTVGEARKMWDGMMAQHMQSSQGFVDAADSAVTPEAKPAIPSFARELPPGQLQAALTHADTLTRRDNVALQADVESRANDAIAAYKRGENTNTVPPALPEYVNAFGAIKGQQLFASQQAWQNYGAAYASLKSQPTSQMQSSVDAWKPTPDSTPLQRQQYDDLDHAAKDLATQRKNQPLETAAASGVYQLQPIDFSDMSQVGAQLAQRNTVATQIAKDYGTPFTNLTQPELKAVSDYVAKAPTSGVAQLFGQIRQGSSNSNQYLGTLAQIAPEHMVPAIAGAIALKQNPMDMGATHWYGDAQDLQKPGDVSSTILDGWRAQNPGKDKDGAQIKASTLPLPSDNNFKKEFQAVVGNTFGTDAQSYNAAYEAAKAHYVGTVMKTNGLGEDWTNETQATFDKSIQAVTGGITNYASRGKVARPWGMTETQFNDAAAKAIPAAVTAAGGDATKYPAESQGLVSVGDGKYRLVNGTSPVVINNKFVDFNLNVPPTPQTAATTPPTQGPVVEATNRGARTLAPTLDKKAR